VRRRIHPTGENSIFKIAYHSSVNFQFGPANCGFQDYKLKWFNDCLFDTQKIGKKNPGAFVPGKINCIAFKFWLIWLKG